MNVKDQAETLRLLTRERPARTCATGKTPRVLAISSGKGGVGKTVLSVNLALRFASLGMRTLLVDLDPGLANVDVHMRLQSPWDVDDVLDGSCRPDQAVLVADRGLQVIPGGRSSEAERERLLTSRDKDGPRRLLDKLNELSSNLDVIVLDTGAGIGPWVQGALEIADQNIVVTQSDPASVTDAYGVIKVAHAIGKDCEPGIVVNRIADKQEALLTATRIRKVAAQFLDFQPELFGWLHDRAEIANSVRTQLPFLLQLEERHAANLELAALAARIADATKIRGKKVTRATSAIVW